MLVTILTSVGVSLLTSAGAFFLQEHRLRAELKTEFMAEQAIRKLLETPRWRKRTFEALKDRIGGFDDNGLRQILVRAGAVKFKDKDGNELWGLIDKNVDDL